MLASDDIHLDQCWSSNSLRVNTIFHRNVNVGRVKSSVDDLIKELSAVSTKVVLYHDLLRLNLRSKICDFHAKSNSTPNHNNNNNAPTYSLKTTECTLRGVPITQANDDGKPSGSHD